MKEKIKIIFNISASTKIMFVVYVFFIIRLSKNGLQRQTLDLQNITILLLGLITLAIYFRIIEIIFYNFTKIAVSIKISSVALYILVGHYHLRTRASLDWAVISDNLGAALYSDSWKVIFETYTLKDINTVIIAIIIMILLELFKNKVSHVPEIKKPKLQLFICITLYFVIIIIAPFMYDEFASFKKSIYDYFIEPNKNQFSNSDKNKFPYIKETGNETIKKNRSQNPHIFILMVESFNANFVNTKNENGLEYTPFYNSLLKKGIYYDNFWGQSVQTARGQLAIFCSILPIIRGKVFTHYPNVNLNCIPEILNENGYVTLFFKGYEHMEFDNTGDFMKRNGFKHVHGMTKDFFTNEEILKYKWGWGIQDNIFYKKFFTYLDDLNEKQSLNNIPKSYFASLTTISHHQKFKDLPKDQRFLYSDPKTKKEYFANSLRASDEYLKTFFDEFYKRDYLEDSIIIITADHSFPAGEHYSYAAENGFYKENFKIPFLFIWNGKNNIYSGVNNRVSSQIDIAPTILDILGISVTNHFMGKSIFLKPLEFIHLIQPYSGTYLSVLKYPYKYSYHKKTKREFLFNLEEDKEESNNLINYELLKTDLYKNLRKEINTIHFNNKLVKENRIWDPGISK